MTLGIIEPNFIKKLNIHVFVIVHCRVVILPNNIDEKFCTDEEEPGEKLEEC
jgi:hypothetical protein